MNKTLLFIYLTFILFACDKEKQVQIPDFILAGQTDGFGIAFVDFEPDENLVVIPPDYESIKLKLDLNKDSIDDFEIVYGYTDRTSCCYRLEAFIISLNNNSVCVLKTDSFTVAPLVYNDIIDSNSTWSDSKAYLFNYWYAKHTTPDGSDLIQTDLDGYWYNTDKFYMGVKIKNDDDDELFGWIDVNLIAGLNGINSGVVRRYSITQPY